MKFFDPVFRVDYDVLTGSQSAMDEWVQSHDPASWEQMEKDKRIGCAGTWLSRKPGAMRCALWFDPSAIPNGEIPMTIVHEAVHAAMLVFEDVGVSEERPYELLAYYTSFIFHEVTRALEQAAEPAGQ